RPDPDAVPERRPADPGPPGTHAGIAARPRPRRGVDRTGGAGPDLDGERDQAGRRPGRAGTEGLAAPRGGAPDRVGRALAEPAAAEVGRRRPDDSPVGRGPG